MSNATNCKSQADVHKTARTTPVSTLALRLLVNAKGSSLHAVGLVAGHNSSGFRVAGRKTTGSGFLARQQSSPMVHKSLLMLLLLLLMVKHG